MCVSIFGGRGVCADLGGAWCVFWSWEALCAFLCRGVYVCCSWEALVWRRAVCECVVGWRGVLLFLGGVVCVLSLGERGVCCSVDYTFIQKRFHPILTLSSKRSFIQ